MFSPHSSFFFFFSFMAARPPRTVIVTGANKGVGFEIARHLAAKAAVVVVTSRDEARGADAVARLAGAAPTRASSPPPTLLSHPLDLASPASIAAFAAWATDPAGPLGGRVDILVNNAGMAFKGDTWSAGQAAATAAVNYAGTRALTDALLPAIPAAGAGGVGDPSAGRIVNVGSRAGQLRIVGDPALRARWEQAADAGGPPGTAGPAAIDALVAEFVAAVADGSYAAKGWPRSMYGVSKLAEAAWTRWLAGVEGRPGGGGGRVVVLACPGACATDMSSGRGRPAAAGADTPAWLATDAPAVEVHGGFWADRERVDF